MAYESESTCLSFPAALNLSGFQYYPVSLTTAGTITTIGSTATKPLGILQDNPDAAGKMGSVCIRGVTKMVCYTGAVNPNDALGVNASSIGAVTTTDNQWVIAESLDAAFADAGVNTILTVDVKGPRRF